MAESAAQSCKRIKLEEKTTDDGEGCDGQPFTDEEVHYFGNRVTEPEAAITEYIGTHRGFYGILKQRFEDFVVHEISKCGKLVVLNDLSLPREKEKNIEKRVSAILTENIWSKIDNVAENKSGEVLIDVSSVDKDERTNVHALVAQRYSFLDTNTVTEGEKKFIKVSLKGENSRIARKWPEDRGSYVHFTLYQENRGTFDALFWLSKRLKMKPKHFQYAGCKDKRGISSQRVSVRRVLPEILLKINEISSKYPQPFAIGNIEFHEDKIRLGDLRGNRFDIVVKEVQFEKESDVDEAVISLKSKGFVNYFGTQRFGFKPSTSPMIGLEILRENWEEAVNMVLSERPKDFKNSFSKFSFNECIRMWKETKDASKVFNNFSTWKQSNEGVLLEALSKLQKSGQHNNYYSAFSSLPRNNRTMFLHAYQSLLWNKLASYRLETYGMKVVPGDLLLFDDTSEDENELEKVEPVIADESNMEKATIYHVVLPVVGTSVTLPQNSVKDKLLELLTEDGLTMESFKTKAKNYMLYGVYRKLVKIPEDVQWSLHSYSDPNVQLIQTDLQLLNNVDIKPPTSGAKKLLKLSFSLSSSTYATVVIRELLKKDVIKYSLTGVD